MAMMVSIFYLCCTTWSKIFDEQERCIYWLNYSWFSSWFKPCKCNVCNVLIQKFLHFIRMFLRTALALIFFRTVSIKNKFCMIFEIIAGNWKCCQMEMVFLSSLFDLYLLSLVLIYVLALPTYCVFHKMHFMFIIKILQDIKRFFASATSKWCCFNQVRGQCIFLV